MAGAVHDQLVVLGAKWQKRQGFSVVATELAVRGTAEQADVISFRSSCSCLIEAKASRSDFLADAKKPHRAAGGLGVYRFYLSLPGVIEIEDLPPRWGLLHAVGDVVVEVQRPTGNMWPPYGASTGDWPLFQHQPDQAAEAAVLFSIARRRSRPRSVERYERDLREVARERERLARRADDLEAQVRELQALLAATHVQNGQNPALVGKEIRRRLPSVGESEGRVRTTADQP
ncbi:hypothetical protein BCO37747_07861 [Burkholderia contaminans]|jgi:hypothetical protein|uniref:Adenylosuccinate synthase n=2 Tax=Burkholderia cepacia complex TaxID=87882 RepID=A0A250LLE9_9BURK|nr:hypothetical protein BED46_024250 [Burkholderia contaminans]OMI79465.1 hypothetical protein BED46_026235 [Burkholderia contaminans]BBA45372.1 hypothetical protein BCCH1_78830 [Burkholderia contaminans]CAB3970303.1 hypothetical protein BLA3211_05867 [Burkholderia aenigmatica]VWD64769.1 hypothetical protein BCO37747_07861 [Burkholderia contaminans]